MALSGNKAHNTDQARLRHFTKCRHDEVLDANVHLKASFLIVLDHS